MTTAPSLSAGDIGEARIEGAEQARALAVLGRRRVARLDKAHVHAAQRLQGLVQRLPRGVGLGATLVEILRGAAVEHHGDHVVQRLTLLFDQRGTAQRAEQDGEDAQREKARRAGAKPQPR